MNIHEYQARELFTKFSIPTPPGVVAETVGEVEKIVHSIPGPWVIKAQVHVGGRGKAGGVKVTKTPSEAIAAAKDILGMTIGGYIVHRVFVAHAVDIVKEYYCAIVMDRQSSQILLMASPDGGIDIEEVAEKTPERIYKVTIDPTIGFRSFHGFDVFSRFLNDKSQINQCISICKGMYDLFVSKDCMQVEINPLAQDPSGTILALDAKLSFDSNALFRQKEIRALEDPDMRDELAESAAEFGLSFVPMDGSVGCLVNGAGLAMATMDVVSLFNGEAANFLDVGGSSDPRKVVRAFEIIMANPKVKSILLNIFGGITRCDDIARGILQAMELIEINVPIIVRLTGTNEKEAAQILSGNKKLIVASGMSEAVRKAVACTK